MKTDLLKFTSFIRVVSLNHYEVRTFEGYLRRRFKDLVLSTRWIRTGMVDWPPSGDRPKIRRSGQGQAGPKNGQLP